MHRLRTHYDRLNVPRTASPETITTAYRKLGKKYHPDLNRGDAKSARIMSMINESYAVLSDARKRRDHDLWIMHTEAHLRNHLGRRVKKRVENLRPAQVMQSFKKSFSAVRIPRMAFGSMALRETIRLVFFGFVFVGLLLLLLFRSLSESQQRLQIDAIDQPPARTAQIQSSSTTTADQLEQ